MNCAGVLGCQIEFCDGWRFVLSRDSASSAHFRQLRIEFCANEHRRPCPIQPSHQGKPSQVWQGRGKDGRQCGAATAWRLLPRYPLWLVLIVAHISDLRVGPADLAPKLHENMAWLHSQSIDVGNNGQFK
jgi:hypothetical protein